MKSNTTGTECWSSATTIACACSRNGTDWTRRYPWIGAEAALKNRETHFVIEGEAVVLGVDGIADFNALHSRQHEDEVQLYAFDILTLDGEDLCGLPLSMRKPNLARLLARHPDGVFEGMVSKRADRPLSGRKGLGEGEEPQASRVPAAEGSVLSSPSRRRCQPD
jgi:hypothetical protein